MRTIADHHAFIAKVLAARGVYQGEAKGLEFKAAKALVAGTPGLHLRLIEHGPQGGQPVKQFGKVVAWGATKAGWTDFQITKEQT